MKVIGLISGTSFDGIDVAAVDFEADGSVLTARLLASRTVRYDPALEARIAAVLPPEPTTIAEVCELDTLIGQAFAEVAADLAAEVGGVDAVCSHGQTVFHWTDGPTALGTLQLGQGAWIAERLGVPTVTDVRIRDIAAGGQGAPLVPILDTLLLAGVPGRPAALNLGGIANITVLRPEGAIAYDTGPANALLDLAVRRTGASPLGYDDGGRLAATGAVDLAVLEQLLSEPYYALPHPKSTGKELYHSAYLDPYLHLAPADLLATLTALTAETVAAELRRHQVDMVMAGGGGVRNETLMAALRTALPGVRVTTTAEFGLPPDTKEAVAFALIGWLTLHALPGQVPSCTGAAGPRVLGTVTPGMGPLPRTPSLPMPTSLKVVAS